MDSVEFARELRVQALKMTSGGKGSHIGSMFSIADIIAVLYHDVLKYDPRNAEWADRDRFILSKGHAGGIVYAALALKGFFPVQELDTYYQDGSKIPGHITRGKLPGVEFSTGALGHGLPSATGRALAAKLDNRKHRIYALLSDGECDEGSNWEAALFAAHHKLGNLMVMIDYNKLQSLDTTENTIGLEPFADKWKAFGWSVTEVDGHEHTALKDVLEFEISDKPKCIIAHTTKGKGVSFMENSVLWHYRSADDAERSRALDELAEGEYR